MGKDLWLRIAILGIGGILFILLWTADKTNLNSEQASDIQAPAEAGEVSFRSELPPLAPDPVLDGQIQRFNQVESPSTDQLPLLDSIINSLKSRNRFAMAANYAQDRVEISDELPYRQEAGVLSQKATELSFIAEDSVLLGQYRDQAIALLTPITEADETNEEALLYLGLAYTRSAMPMQGILKVRKVVEINPDNIDANLRLGEFSLQTGQFDKARQRFEKVLSLQPDNHAARLRLAVALAQTGEQDAAKAALEKVLAESDDISLKQDASSILNQLN